MRFVTGRNVISVLALTTILAACEAPAPVSVDKVLFCSGVPGTSGGILAYKVTATNSGFLYLLTNSYADPVVFQAERYGAPGTHTVNIPAGQARAFSSQDVWGLNLRCSAAR